MGAHRETQVHGARGTRGGTRWIAGVRTGRIDPLVYGLIGVSLGVAVIGGIAAHAPTIPPKPTSAASIQLPAKVIQELPDLSLAPCKTEDATNCYWDAATMGNGRGTSFINWDGQYYYPKVGTK